MAKKAATSRSAKADPSRPLGPDCRVVLLAGKEAYLRAAYTRRLKEEIEKTGETVDLVTFDGASASPADVLDECRSMGLLAGHKLVVVDDADQLVKEDNRPLFERYAAAPAPGATLVLRAETWHKGKLDAAIEKVGLIQRCDALSPGEATKAAVKRARDEYARTLEPDAAERLIDLTGPDLARIDSELAKLAARTKPGAPITAALVREGVGLSREEKAFAIQDVLLNSRPEPALTKLRELIEVSRQDPVPIRWACIDLARKLHALSAEIAAGTPPYAAGKSLRLWGPSAQRIRAVAAAAPPGELADLLHESVESDYRGKSGRGDPVIGLEVLAIRFASVTRHAADT